MEVGLISSRLGCDHEEIRDRKAITGVIVGQRLSERSFMDKEAFFGFL